MPLQKFHFQMDALDLLPIDKESRAIAVDFGMPEYEGIKLSTAPFVYNDSISGKQFVIFATGYKDLYHLGIDPSGKVWAVYKQGGSFFVNTTFGCFIRCIHLIAINLGRIRLAEDAGDIAALKSIHSFLINELKVIDPECVCELCWWTSAIRDLS